MPLSTPDGLANFVGGYGVMKAGAMVSDRRPSPAALTAATKTSCLTSFSRPVIVPEVAPPGVTTMGPTMGPLAGLT